MMVVKELLLVVGIFFYIGLFTVGGGLAALPLIQQEIVGRGWITMQEYTSMVAISESTPGPIGINMATYVGFERLGVWGGILATIGTVIPSLIIIIVIAKFYNKFREQRVVDAGFQGLRPAVTGLIATAAWQIITITVIHWQPYVAMGGGFSLQALTTLIDWKALLLFAGVYLLNWKLKKHPIVYIALGAVVGVCLF